MHPPITLYDLLLECGKLEVLYGCPSNEKRWIAILGAPNSDIWIWRIRCPSVKRKRESEYKQEHERCRYIRVNNVDPKKVQLGERILHVKYIRRLNTAQWFVEDCPTN